MQHPAIQNGHDYPIVLGSSFDSESLKSQQLTIVSYDFVPASVDKSGEGCLVIEDNKDQDAHIDLPSTATDTPLHFSGKYETTSDRLDCVAIFEGDHFRIELVDAHAHLRHDPGKKRDKNPPPIQTKQKQLGKKKKPVSVKVATKKAEQDAGNGEQVQQQQNKEQQVQKTIDELFGQDTEEEAEPQQQRQQNTNGGDGGEQHQQQGGSEEARQQQQLQRQDEGPQSELERSFFEGSL